MPAENPPSFEAMSADIDNAVRMSLRKPAAALAVGVAMIIGGQVDNAAEQPHADRLAAQVDESLDGITPSEAEVVTGYLHGEDLPVGTESSLVETAENIKAISDQQKKKDDAGGFLTGLGAFVVLGSGIRMLTHKISGSLIKDRLREKHPDLAPARLDQEVKRLFEIGYSVETTDQFTRKHRDWTPERGRWDEFERQQLQEIGHDIEASGEFTTDETQFNAELTEFLNKAQWGALLDSGFDTSTEVSGADDLELFKVGIMDDLWEPANTFTSLTDWYIYRRMQIVKPHAFHKVDIDELHLPELQPRIGGIGIAVGRVGYYIRIMETNGADREAKSNAMVYAIEGAATLDRVAPRSDGVHWFDHLQTLERKAFSTAVR